MLYRIFSFFLKMCIITPKLAQISRKYCKYLNLCYNVSVKNFIILLIGWNLITFLMYGADKRRARKNQWRISENTLILSAFFMGAAGSFLGMYVFHHKTMHKKFTLLIPLAAVVNFAVILFAAGKL